MKSNLFKKDGTNYEYGGNCTFTIDSSFFKDTQIINLQPVSSIGELHETLSIELKFPEFYGMNWDAFGNAISGLVEMPKILKLTGWKEFSVRFPDDSKRLKEITHDFNNQFYEKKIVIEGITAANTGLGYMAALRINPQLHIAAQRHLQLPNKAQL